MNVIMLTAIIANAILVTAIKPLPVITEPQKGIVQGRVTDTKGNPVAGVRVVIENTVFYASYVHTRTNADGYYKATVPNGSWHVSVAIEKEFLGKTYRFELHPDVDDNFAGTKGAIRNFTWRLSGAKPGGAGFYGSNIAVYSEPGSAFSMNEIQLTLTPDGPLVDGSSGAVITSKLTDIGGGEDGIKDVPVGRYSITAINTTTRKPLQIRYRNKGEYAHSLTAIFEHGFSGVYNYQVVVQVR